MKEDKSFQIELGDIAVKRKLGIESIESLMKNLFHRSIVRM